MVKEREMKQSKIKKGSIFIAHPSNDTSFLSKTVILICDATETGCFGLIINKPMPLSLAENLIEDIDIENLALLTPRVGGVIQSDQMMLLHNEPSNSKQTIKIAKSLYLGGDANFLKSHIGNAGFNATLCFGYIAWNIGILESEIDCGAWIAAKSTKKHILDFELETMWKTMISECSGENKLYSSMPDDVYKN